MKPKALFLDFYGTLLDPSSDRQAHRSMVRAMADRYGLKGQDEPLLEAFEGTRRRYFNPARGFWTGREVIETATMEFLRGAGASVGPRDLPWLRALYLDEHRRHLRLVPPAPEALTLLGSLPLHPGLISDIDREFLTFVRGLFHLDRYLQSFTTSEEVGATKPNPRIFQAAVAKAGCSPGEAVHVGDLPEKDIRGAKAAGLMAILVGPGVDDGGADHRVGDVLEAVTLVADMVGRD